MTSPVGLGRPTVPDERVLVEHTRSIISTGRYSNDGERVRELERRILGMLTGSRPADCAAHLVSSGTAALTTALLALRTQPSAGVITSPLTFPATALAIEAAGLRPVLADADPDTLLLSPDAVGDILSSAGQDIAAIMPVHLFGSPVDQRIDDLAREHGVPVVFDAAHAFHPEDPDGLAARGSAACYSLHATKLLHSGEGGMVTTSFPEVSAGVAAARAFGLVDGVTTAASTNAKLPELSAALGLAVLPRVAEEVEAREGVRAAYDAVTSESSRAHPHPHGAAVLFHAIRCEASDQRRLLEELRAAGVMARTFPALSRRGSRWSDTAATRALSAATTKLDETVIALPIHSGVQPHHIEAVAAALGAAG